MMDEPSLGLAPLLVKEIFNIIREINQNGTTILLIEQNAKAALQIAHYACFWRPDLWFSKEGKELLKMKST